MAVLSDTDRASVSAGLQRFPPFLSVSGVVKASLQSAINAGDVWIDTNTSSFTSALPDPFKTNSSANQKLFLFIAILTKRFDANNGTNYFGRIFGG